MGGKHICLFVFFKEVICRTDCKLISNYVIYNKYNFNKTTLKGNYCYSEKHNVVVIHSAV